MTQTLEPDTAGAAAASKAEKRVAAWLADFEAALSARDVDRAAGLFATTCFWRDLVAFTGTSPRSRTAKASPTCSATPSTTPTRRASPRRSRSTRPTASSRRGSRSRPRSGGVEGLLRGSTRRGRGPCSPRSTSSRGTRSPAAHAAPRAWSTARSGTGAAGRSARARRAASSATTRQPYVVVVGGGQGGIALGARLRQLGVPTWCSRRTSARATQWRSRYKSLCLHDPVWYDHLPYLEFPDNWPVFSPKDKIGDWLEMYTRVMEINYWSSTTVDRRAYDEEAAGVDGAGRPRRRGAHAAAQAARARHRHVRQAQRPDAPGPGRLRAASSTTPAAHPGPDRYAGKRAVVIGSNNSAHDICAALWEAGADVTMVQRSSTHIVKSDTLMEHRPGRRCTPSGRSPTASRPRRPT